MEKSQITVGMIVKYFHNQESNLHTTTKVLSEPVTQGEKTTVFIEGKRQPVSIELLQTL